MDLIITFLAAMSGALVGASVGVYIVASRLRPDKAELDTVRARLQSTESSLKMATGTIDRQRQQIAEQEQTVQQSGETLKEKQKQLEMEAAKRAAADERAEQLVKETALLKEAAAASDSQAKEQSDRAAEELRQRLASYEAQLEATGLEIRQLAEKAEGATTESAKLRQRCEQEAHDRLVLEEQLSNERKQAQELAGQISERDSEFVRIGQQLQEERRSAAKRMELLVKAQENLAALVQAAGAATNGNGNSADWQALPTPVNAEVSVPEGGAAEIELVSAVNWGLIR